MPFGTNWLLIFKNRIFFRILIKFNVNHSVDDANATDSDVEFDNQQQAQQEPPKLLSKPTLEVDIVKNDTTLSLTCTYLGGQPTEGEYGNIFFSQIREIGK